METIRIIDILKQVDIDLLLKQKYLKAVLADLLYEYENERKILNMVNNSTNVVKRLADSNNKLIELENLNQELLSFGLNEAAIKWALDIWAGALNINQIDRNIRHDANLSLSLGGAFTIALFNNDYVYVWGNNRWGQLGVGNKIDYIKPQDITASFNLGLNEKVNAVAASFRSSYLLTDQGRLFAWGNNEYGQLGDETMINSNLPMDITNRFKLATSEKIIKISAGGFHALLLTNQNRIFTWGNNQYGQLGDGTYINKSKPINITPNCLLKNGEFIQELYAGLGHSLFITTVGRIFTWGNNKYGQLGVENLIKENVPLDITQNIPFINGESIGDCSVGSLHSLIATSQGRLYTFGNNEDGQLGDNTLNNSNIPVEISRYFNPQERIIKVSAGRNFSIALTSLGHVYTWGNNKKGQLGINDFITNSKGPIDITNKLVQNENETIVDIFTGSSSNHAYAVSSQNNIYAWGNNEYGQLGESSSLDIYVK